jgi:hypothetical protein
MVLHSEHRKRPDFTAFNFLEQAGHGNILGNVASFSTAMLLLKKFTDSSRVFLILKNWEKPSSWKTS